MFFSPQYMKFHFCFTIVGQLYCHTANIAKVDMLIFRKHSLKYFGSTVTWLHWQTKYPLKYLLTIFAKIFVDTICQNICWQYLPKSLLTIFARIFGRIFVDTGIAEAGPALEAGGGADASAASATCLSPPSQPLTCFGLDFSSNSKGFLEQFHQICFAKKYPNNRQQSLWFEILVEFQMIWKHS